MVNHFDETIAETYTEERAQMCFLLASMPELPRNLNTLNMQKYCYGLKLKSVMSGGPESAVLSQKYLSQPFSKRSCVYKDFLQKSKIY